MGEGNRRRAVDLGTLSPLVSSIIWCPGRESSSTGLFPSRARKGKERPLKKKVTDSCFQTHTSSLWQLSFPSFIGSFFSQPQVNYLIILFWRLGRLHVIVSFYQSSCWIKVISLSSFDPAFETVKTKVCQD